MCMCITPFAPRTVLASCAHVHIYVGNAHCVVKHMKLKDFQLSRASKLIRVDSRRFSLTILSFAYDASRARSKAERLRLR